MTLPLITCLCPTYRRPTLLKNIVACFEAQTYPADRRRLVILDDSGELGNQSGDGWELVCRDQRFDSLPEKYNALVELAGQTDIVAVWEDDDIYFPWHLEAHAETLAGSEWSVSSKMWCLYSGMLLQEDKELHAALAITRPCLERIGGWPVTRQGQFDWVLFAALRAGSSRGDPIHRWSPGYCFRWGSTGSYHGQAFQTEYTDTRWWDRVPDAAPSTGRVEIHPEFDAETLRCYAAICKQVLQSGGQVATITE